MIKYKLKCHNSHEFESWFSNSHEFEKLKENKYKIEESENGSIARQHIITTGRQNGDFVSIISGATVGDVVVSAGAFKLRNGISVRVNNDLAPMPELRPSPDNS